MKYISGFKKIKKKLRIKFKTNSMKFIDDVIIYVYEKTAKENYTTFTKIAKSLFEWAGKNHVIFDDDKSELIHFEKSRKESGNTMTLPNKTNLQSKKKIKYLEFWLDRKLNFRNHCQTHVTNAKKALYAMMSLLNSEWELLSNAVKQFYFTCIVSIADDDSEI